MAAPQMPLLAVLLLAFLVLHSSSSLPPCPQSCICKSTPLLNCSSSGLSVVPPLIQDSVTELDLSHNLLSSLVLHQPHPNLRNVWLGNNSITYLSLCIERNLKDPRLRRRLRTQSRIGCLVWGPALQLLSAERNLLEQLPEGLGGVRSLKVLQLSFNRISTLKPGVLSHLQQLKELHLQHNLITHLYPQTFQDLDQLRVLDLRFNMLTSLHPLMYLTLRSIDTDVQLDGNRWQCDCHMRSLQRRMAYDSSRGLQAWSMVCTFPSRVLGRDLLQLQEEDFDCSGTENHQDFHQDVTVYSGSEILLSCSAQDSMLWTPSDKGSVSQHSAGLLISDVSESNTGLYVCVSEENQVVSVFNLQISKTGGARKARSLPKSHSSSLPQNAVNRVGEVKAQPTESDLALAVCLSVFITFLLAFILGVLARPWIDMLCKRVAKKKSPAVTHTVSSAEQRQYDNEAYSIEEQEDPGPFRERRVTFSTVDFIEDSNIQRYDTTASGDQESISSDVVIKCEGDEAEPYDQTAGDSGSERLCHNSSENKQSHDRGSGDSNEKCIQNMEFEHIPDSSELEEGRSLSSCSDSSLSEKISEEDQLIKRQHVGLNSPQLAEDSVQQRPDFSTKTEVTQISMEGKTEIIGISSGPSLHTKAKNSLDSDNEDCDNEELFEFSDSAESPTIRSRMFDSYNNLQQIQEPTSDKQNMEGMSSSSSYISEDEPTHYTVNSDQDSDQGGNYDSSSSSDSENKTRDHVNKQEEHKAPMSRPPYKASQTVSKDPEYQWPTLNLEQITQIRRRLDIKAPSLSLDSFYNSESDDETKSHIQKQEQEVLHMSRPPMKVSQIVKQENQWPTVDLGRVTQFKRRLDVKAPSMSSDLSPSSDSEDENKRHIKYEDNDVQLSRPLTKTSQVMLEEPENQWPIVDLDQRTRIKRRIDIKASSPSLDLSSSSDSEDRTKGYMKKQGQEEVNMTRRPSKASQIVTNVPTNQWPSVDLGQKIKIKRRLDIKAPSQSSDSSSSNKSDDETKSHLKKQEQEVLQMSRPPFKVSQTVKRKNQWPTVDLGRVTQFKRRLDVKAPSMSSNSSSSSDSEDENKRHIKYEEDNDIQLSRPLTKTSQVMLDEPGNQWPIVDLEQRTRIKRRIDIKASSPSLDLSSSSESEGRTKGYIKKLEQEEVHMPRPPSKASQTVTKMPKNQWPSVDLGKKRKIKRRLDIKAPSQSFDSISSSNSEDETTGHLKKQEQAEVHMSRHSIKVPQTVITEPGNQWPIVDLGQLTRVKRRIDIKASSQSSDSSSNKDRQDEAKGHIVKQEQEKVNISRPPIKLSQTVTKLSENQWPSVDLVQVTQIKRRLDFKGPSPSFFDLSSSSESENETTGHIQKQGQEEVYISRPPDKVSQTMAKVPENQWPTVDLGRTRIKRRLDIKATKPISDSSSGSDSEDKATGHMQKKGHEKVLISQPPVKVSQTVTREPYSQWPTVDFGRLPQIKRRLDIKGPSQGLDSSSSRDNGDETKAPILKQEQDEVHKTNPPIKVSQTMTKVPEKQWPVVDIEQIPQIKRRLDFKGPSQSPNSPNSHCKDDTKGYIKEQNEEEVHMSRSPIKVSTTMTNVPETHWPTIGLEQIKIKRRLDIKALSQSSGSSISNESDDETKSHLKNQEQEVLQMSRPPTKLSQTVTKVPENQWPAIGLGQVTQIKRRLDFKGPSQSSGSSSSSHIEDETKGYTQRLEQEEVHMPRPPVKASQTLTKVPENQWPAIGLGQIRIKRRLDIKAPSPISNSSLSSDREDETEIHRHGQDEAGELMPILPIKVSQTLTKIPENQWPTVDLGQITQIKRRLDFKGPSPSSSSSSSSHSKDETKHYIKEQKEEEVHVSRSPIKVSTTVTKVPETHWPTIGLEQIKIKRRLDIKAPSQSSDSSSSNKSDDETKSHLKNQEQEVLQMSRPPIKLSQTVTEVPENHWPTIGLEQIKIKRRLDIKAPTPGSNSSITSDNIDETKTHIKTQEQEEVHKPSSTIKVSQTVIKVPENQWPTVDLGQVTHIKRRLDFKGPSPSSGSSSSSHSKDETKGYIKEQKEEEVHVSRSPIKVSTTVTKVPENHWPTIGLEQIKIKRRLDIKAPTPGSNSSFTSDNEDETKTHINTQEQEEVHEPSSTIKVSTTVTKVPENQWPTVDLGQVTQIKRRLDFKGLSPDSGSSSSSNREDETADHTEKWVQEKVHISQPLDEVSRTVTRDPNSQWPTVDFGQLTQIKRRLDFKAPTQSSESSSSSEQGVRMTLSSIKVSQSVTKVSENQWPVVDLEDVTQIKRRLDFKAPPLWSPSSRHESEDVDKDLQAHERMEYSAISSTSENNVIKSSDVPVINIFHSPRKDHNIKLEKYSVIPDHLENKPTNDTIDVTPDINPELQTRWAAMNLGISRFRKRLEITPSTTEPPSLSSPYSEHSSNTETRPGGRPRLRRKIVGIPEIDSSPVLENKTQNVSITLKDPYDKYTSSGNKKPSVTEGKKTDDTMLSGFGSQHVKRYEDIWIGEKASITASQHQPYTFSRSDSEYETVNMSVPDLSTGVPRIKRRLDIKAPSLEPSNSSSFINKSEKDVMEYSESRQISTVLETTDDSLITYKRSIIKDSSPLSWNSFPPIDRSQSVDSTFITQVEDDRNASLVPRTGQSVSFDHTVKSKIRQSRSNTDVDLLDEIRWTGVGHRLSDLSEPSLNAFTVTQPQSPPLDTYSSSSVIHKMQDNGKSNVTLINKYSSLDTKGVSPSSSDSLNTFGISPLRTNETKGTVSEDRQMRGLGALKTMSLERRLWETDYGKDSLASSDGLQDDTQFDYGQSKKDIDVIPKEPLKHLPSASVEKRKDADLLLLLYGVPRYKGHSIKGPLQEAPPPLPETPPPDD